MKLTTDCLTIAKCKEDINYDTAKGDKSERCKSIKKICKMYVQEQDAIEAPGLDVKPVICSLCDSIKVHERLQLLNKSQQI